MNNIIIKFSLCIKVWRVFKLKTDDIDDGLSAHCEGYGIPTDGVTEVLFNSHATPINSHKIARNRGSTPIKGRYFTCNSQQLYADEESFFIGFFCA